MERSIHLKTAFVLSGGGSAGAVQAGMVRALYERGIVPDFIVGSSVGALNGSFLASRPATLKSAFELAAIWTRLRFRGIFPLSPFRGLRALSGHSNHLVSSLGLAAVLSRWLEFERLEDAPTPLHVIATDLLSGQAVRLSEGQAVPAILASSAIPGVLPTVRIEGLDLVDGGVTDNNPVSHAWPSALNE